MMSGKAPALKVNAARQKKKGGGKGSEREDRSLWGEAMGLIDQSAAPPNSGKAVIIQFGGWFQR